MAETDSADSRTRLLSKRNLTMGLFWKQTSILVWKSLIVRRVHYISTIFEILGPILFVLLLSILYSKLNISNSGHSDDSINNFSLAKNYSNPYFPIKFNHSHDGKIFYVPKNNDDKLVNALVDCGYRIFTAENESALKSKIIEATPVDNNDIYFETLGLNFEDIDVSQGRLKYQIILPMKIQAKRFLDPFPLKFDQTPVPYIPEYNKQTATVYSCLNREFVMQFSQKYNLNNVESSVNKVNLNRMPYPSYRKPVGFSIYEFVALYILVCYTLVCPLIVKRITDEKSTKSKELLRMIGMSDLVYWSSHFLNHLLVVIIHSICITIILFNGNKEIFVYSSSYLFFLMLVLFGIQTIMYSMLISTVFTRPVLAVMVTIILWLVFSGAIFIRLVPSVNKESAGNEALLNRVLSSFIPQGSLFWFISLMGSFENVDTGLNFSSLSSSTVIYGDLTEIKVISIVISSYFIYAFLIWYLDNVWPFQYGIPKPPWFLFKSSYWFPKNIQIDPNERREDLNVEIFEPDPIGVQPAIEIRNLTKTFGVMSQKKIAVDGLWLNIFKKQLTVLLGHNGAGKSTTMNMITGMFSANSGEIIVDGYNVFTQTNNARRSIGLCPQENILFNELTVFQHLKLFAILKNSPAANLNQEIEKILSSFQLTDKKNVLASRLSGGMKRKLQLGMAIIGNTEILILDEPTSGLDPEARRHIWDFLISIRREKAILLTTHYMEEADVLGDRIAIMNHGKLCCSGSPYFLKNAFGTGYQLRIEKVPQEFDSNMFLKTCQRYIPTTTLKSEMQTEVIYSLNQKSDSGKSNTNSLISMFKHIETNLNQYGISSFGLMYSTLEDVFIAVDNVKSLTDINEMDAKNQKDESTLKIPALTKQSQLLTGWSLMCNQFLSLLVKRFHYSRRYWSMFILQLLIPTFIIMLSLKISNQIQSLNQNELAAVDFNVQNLYGEDTESYYRGPTQLYESYKRFNEKYGGHVLRDDNPQNKFNDFILEHDNIDLNSYIKKNIYGLEVPVPNNDGTYNVWFNGEQSFSIPLSLKIFFESLLQSIAPQHLKNDVSIDMSLKPLIIKSSSTEDGAEPEFMFILISWVVSCLIFLPVAIPFLAASYALYPIKERLSKSKLIQFMTGLSPTLFWLANFIFDLIYHLLSIVILFTVIYLSDSTGVFFDEKTSPCVLFVMLLAFGFGTIPLSYIFSFIFNSSASGFLYLVIIYLLFGLIANIFWSVIDLVTNTLSTDLAAIAWANQLLPLLRMVPIFSMLFGYQKLFKSNSFVKICENMKPVLDRVCYTNNTGVLIKGCCPNLCEKDNSCYDSGSFSFGKFGSGQEILFLFLSGIIYFIIIIIFENFKQYFLKYFSWDRCLKKKQSRLDVQENKFFIEDSDVLREKQRIENILQDPFQKNNSDIFIAHHLTKIFGNFTAVNDLSFGVANDECFGLLGVNGAGKTTTFSMLTGDLFPTEGNAYINGDIALIEDLKLFRKNIGYCPQFDALLDNLTGEETLYLMASLRGVPKSNISRDVSALIEMVDLQAHAKKVTSAYSGGNKRKLSIALSLIGNPPLLFLDEPTTGVDPQARRKVWKTLEMIKNNFKSAIILTSHSMEECEALCTKIAIMTKGRFRCLGSTQHLRSKFGQGYSIMVRLKREHETDQEYNRSVCSAICQTIPSANLNDQHNCLMDFYVSDTSLSWSRVFELMAELDRKWSFEDYVISGTTLENVFISFARHQ